MPGMTDDKKIRPLRSKQVSFFWLATLFSAPVLILYGYEIKLWLQLGTWPTVWLFGGFFVLAASSILALIFIVTSWARSSHWCNYLLIPCLIPNVIYLLWLIFVAPYVQIDI
jgi:hypothetical protein